MQRAYKTTDLAPDERVAVERLLGRELENDEAVEIIAHKASQLPVEQQAERRKALARIRELAKGKSLGDVTVRDLIDEGRRF
jgi:hypothetical protein